MIHIDQYTWVIVYMDLLLFCLRYPGKLGCCLQPEVDGLRVISNTTSEFMHRVTSMLILHYNVNRLYSA